MTYDLSQYEVFHGTTLENLESIKEIGLIGLLGNFVQEAYDEEIEMLLSYHDLTSEQELEMQLDEEGKLAVYLTTEDDLDRAFNAILAQTANLLGKRFHYVTKEDIKRHGVLLGFDEAEGLFQISDAGEIYQLALPEYDEPEEELFLNKYVMVPRPDVERPIGAEPWDLFTDNAGIPQIAISGEELVNLMIAAHYPLRTSQ